MLMIVAKTVYAQDVIVKRDGTTILSKVLEVNKNEIKYKKFSNQKGPLYIIEKTEVMAINYECGDKDLYTNAVRSASSENSSLEKTDLVEENLQLVREYNDRKVEYVGPNGDKTCGYYDIVLRMEEGSIIETPELRIEYKQEPRVGRFLEVSLYNKTNKAIYIDLANSYFIECDNARPLFVPSSTSSGKSSTSGGSVNVGAVTSAIGIGGAVGTLAGGINVGGANTSTNTTTVYSQRIISVPPMASISLNDIEIFTRIYKTHTRDQIYSKTFLKYAPFFKSLGIIEEKFDSYIVKSGKMRCGQIVDIPRIPGNELDIHITYSLDEGFTNAQSMRTKFYFSQVVAMPRGIEEDSNVKMPLLYTSQLSWRYKIMKR